MWTAPPPFPPSNGSTVRIVVSLHRHPCLQVVANSISALNEILAEEGGLAINKAIIHHLLNRIKEFSEWGQCLVLDLVAKYKPDNHVWC